MENTPANSVAQNNPSQPKIPPRDTESSPVANDQQPPTGDQVDLPADNAPIQVPDHSAGALDQEGNFPCYFCFSSFTTQKALLEHLRINPPPPVYPREELMHLGLLQNPEADDDDEEVAADIGGGGELSEEAPPDHATAEADQGARATTRAPLGIDLNVEAPPELPDLNLSPPPNDGND